MSRVSTTPFEHARPGGENLSRAAHTKFRPLVVGFLPLPSLVAFFDQQPHDHEQRRGVDPPRAECQLPNSPISTTKDSQPQVMLSTASVRKARLPSASAICNFRRDRSHMIGIAARLTNRPGQEKSAPWRVHKRHPAATTM